MRAVTCCVQRARLSTCLTLHVSLAVLGSDFQKYMEAFKPFLAIGLKNYAEYQVGLAQLITTSCFTVAV